MASGFAVSALDVAPLLRRERRFPLPSQRQRMARDEAIAIYHLNPPRCCPASCGPDCGNIVAPTISPIGPGSWRRFRADWVDSIRFVDAIMVPSEFCRAAVARYTDKPVRVVPHPLDPRRRCRHAAATPTPPFTVLVDAEFRLLLRPQEPSCGASRLSRWLSVPIQRAKLIFKTSGGHRYPNDLAQLRAEIGMPPMSKSSMRSGARSG